MFLHSSVSANQMKDKTARTLRMQEDQMPWDFRDFTVPHIFKCIFVVINQARQELDGFLKREAEILRMLNATPSTKSLLCVVVWDVPRIYIALLAYDPKVLVGNYQTGDNRVSFKKLQMSFSSELYLLFCEFDSSFV